MKVPQKGTPEYDAWSRQLMGGYTDEQLSQAFDKVKDKEHWKNPIDAVVGESEDLELICFAVPYYTATLAETQRLGNGKVRITADGYWAGPAGGC